MKKCSKCLKFKPTSDFHKDKTKPDGLYNSCKHCVKMTRNGETILNLSDDMRKCKKCLEIKHMNRFGFREKKRRNVCKKCCAKYKKDWAVKNHDKIKNSRIKHQQKLDVKKYMKDYRENNKDKINFQKRMWAKNNPEKILKSRIKNKSKRNKWLKFRLRNDINFKLSVYLRNRLNSALRGNIKNGSSVKDIGCSLEEFKIYLESKFKPGMTWKNWSRSGWHIDHIRPLSSFDLTNREHFLEACHYTNLQPLWAVDNLKKGAKYE